MHVSDILHKLPASLEWMVLFNLSPLRALADDTVVKAMFFLPDNTQLDAYSHVILSSQGRYLAPYQGSELRLPEGAIMPPLIPATSDVLAHRFTRQLQLFSVDEADCLGVGQAASWPPVLLFVQVRAGCAEAKAIFQQPPSQRHYELLPAIGVQFKGGSYQGGYYLAEFTNRLPVHIHAGLLAHFSRTSHCNQFFLQHGHIDTRLATGLALAAKDRVTWARDRSLAAVVRLGQQACQQSLAMTCQPPPPAPAYPFGDLVPLSFLLKALAIFSTQSAAAETGRAVQQLLLNRRQGRLWAFHTGRLVTSTDSALVLQGWADMNGPHSSFHKSDFTAAIAALETFADGQGGYYPQLSTDAKVASASGSNSAQPGRMVADPSNQHWRQPDYATSCLVRGLRHAAGLPVKTSLAYLAAGFETRSGLYFANPYLVDWALATAIHADEAAADLRQQLLSEILGSMNNDYTFGRYEVALSTALAILSLAALGYRGQTLRLAQLRLLEFMDPNGLWPAATPFYSTLIFDHTRLPSHVLLSLLLNNQAQQIIQVKGQYHAVSLYRDTHQMIATALAGLALAEKCRSASQDPATTRLNNGARHPRYECVNQSEYIAQFALPPYLNIKKGI